MCERRLAEGAGTWIGLDALRKPQEGELYHGSMAEYCVVPAYCCYRVPDSIRDEQLAAIEGVAFSVRCIRGAGLRLGDDVVMFGAADYCIEWIQWARKLGARRLAVETGRLVFGQRRILRPYVSRPLIPAVPLRPLPAVKVKGRIAEVDVYVLV